MNFQIINGELVNGTDTNVHLSDVGLNRGYAIFDFFKVLKGKPVFWEDYLDRFERSARMMYLEIPFSRQEIIHQVRQLIKANQIVNGGIKILLTGGNAADGATPGKPNLFVLSIPELTPTQENYQKGLHLMSWEYERELPEVKTTNYLMALLLRHKIKEMGAQDVLYYKNGLVSESARSNFFIITSNELIATPNKGILEGITRKKLIGLAKESFKVELRPVAMEEVFAARGAFISSSNKGAISVTKIDGKLIGTGQPHPITLELNQRFRTSVATYLDKEVEAKKEIIQLEESVL